MATPRNNTYSVGSGGGVFAGRPNLLPTWVPAAGEIVNVGTSTLFNSRPSGWPTGENAGPVANWACALWLPEYGAQGGYAMLGSGHLSPGSPLWAGLWVWDVATRTWFGYGVPPAPLPEYEPANTGEFARDALYNNYGECIVSGLEGHPYTPHTYYGLVYQPPSMGGGVNGSILRVFFAGAPFANCVHRYPLATPGNTAPTRVIDDIAMGGSSVNYAINALDRSRNGFWLLTYGGRGPIKFVSFADFSVTNFSGIEYNDYGDNWLIHLPAPYDTLIGMGRNNSEATGWAYRSSVITSDTPGAFETLTVSGTPPPRSTTGGAWSAKLGAIVCYDGRGSFTVYKLTPPSAANVRARTGTWVWTSETLAGPTPITYAADTNSGMYGRLQPAPEIGCALLTNSIFEPMQAFGITGLQA